MSRLIIGISGASGVIYGVRLLELLRETPVETHLVMTRSAQITLAYETDYKVADVQALADHHYGADDIAAAISSGSFRTMGMVVAPCSMRSLAEIAYGMTTHLLTRAADVVLHLGHLRAMVGATEAGAVIAPPVPAFYAKPQSIGDMVDYTLARTLDLFDLDLDLPALNRWKGG